MQRFVHTRKLNRRNESAGVLFLLMSLSRGKPAEIAGNRRYDAARSHEAG